MLRFKLQGAKELEAALRALPNNIAKNVVTRSLKEVAQPIASDAESRTRVGTDSDNPGRLKRGVAVGTKLSKRQRKLRKKTPGEIVVFVGAPAVQEATTEEFGTGPRMTDSGKYTGQVAAHPFMRPAWEAGKARAFTQLASVLRKRIEAAARRLAKKPKGA